MLREVVVTNMLIDMELAQEFFYNRADLEYSINSRTWISTTLFVAMGNIGSRSTACLCESAAQCYGFLDGVVQLPSFYLPRLHTFHCGDISHTCVSLYCIGTYSYLLIVSLAYSGKAVTK